MKEFVAAEIERLKTLVPEDLRSNMDIRGLTKKTTALLHPQKLGANEFLVEIDFLRWFQLDLAERDLLFWHEIARIQQHSIEDTVDWQKITFFCALGISLIQLTDRNFLLLALVLLIVVLTGFQLYQRNRGERALRQASQADRGAIFLATKFGYSLSNAYHNLHQALLTLLTQTPQGIKAAKLKTRLQVLEIWAIKNRKFNN